MDSSLALGAALGLVGLVGYFATGRKSVTALIPLFFGLLFAALGYVGTGNGITAKLVLGLAVLGFFGTARSYVSLAKGQRGAATVSKAAMATLCLLFLLAQLS